MSAMVYEHGMTDGEFLLAIAVISAIGVVTMFFIHAAINRLFPDE
jgi:hypothetical protein